MLRSRFFTHFSRLQPFASQSTKLLKTILKINAKSTAKNLYFCNSFRRTYRSA